MKVSSLPLLLLFTRAALADPGWDRNCERLRAVAETYKKWGITFDLKSEETFKGRAGPLPSYLKVSGGYESSDTVHMNVEAGLGRNEGLAISLVGDFKQDASGQVTSGGGSMHIKGNGIGGKFTYSRSDGFQFETGLEETFYSLGVRFGEKDKGPLALGLKLGPMTVAIDPIKWGQRCHEMLPRMVGGVLIQVDLPALASALNNAPPPEEFSLRDITVVSLRRLLQQPGQVPLTSICGVACDSQHGDILLLGRREAGQPSLPLATLVAVLRCNWQDGLSPYVSLDPDPADRGLMKVRLGGLSPGLDRSQFVNTMLTADYGMKQVVNGNIAMEGMQTLEQQIAADPSLPDSGLSRFWLAPRPPESGDIAVLRGPSGTVYTIDSEPTLRTETDGEDSGPLQIIHRRSAASFTRLYPQIESVHPELELSSIRQIFQLATVAAVLRKEPPAPACLELLQRFCALPVESVVVPGSYVASQKRIPQPNGQAYLLWGGVDAKADLSAVQMRADTSLAALFEQIQAAPWNGVSVSLPYAFAPVIADAQQLTASEMVIPQLENAALLGRTGQAREALQQLDRVLEVVPQSVSAHLLRMDALHSLRSYEPMRAAGEKAVQLAPDNPRAWYLLSVACKELQRYPEALEYSDHAIRLQPTGSAYLIRSEARCAAGEGQTALEDANQALNLNPGLTRGFIVRAKARLALKDLAGAHADLSTAISRRPSSASSYRMRALVSESMQNYAAAAADWRRVVELEPDPTNVVDLVQVSIKAGDYDGAVRYSNWVLEIQPELGWAWQLRGIAWQAGGHWKEALSDFRKAVQLAPQLNSAIQPRIEECIRHLP